MTMPGRFRNVRGSASRACSVLVAVVSLICASAFAQSPPGVDAADPPVRVGRLAYFTGQVSYSPAGDDQWVQAQINRPVVTGDRLWADLDARVEVSLDSSSWFLGSLTSITVANLDDRVTQVQLQQGTLDVRLRRVAPGATVEIDTPNIAFSLTRPGRYRVDVDAEGNATTVTVRSGMGVAYGNDVSYEVMAGQAYRFHGSDAHDNAFLAAAPYDEFDRWAAARERRFDNAEAARYVSPEVVGYADLDSYGTWNPVPEYGNVWFPTTVVAGWAPYRYGRWAWISPWGWTWVDDAAWGFAPFHYGRWVYLRRRWGWIPGPINVAPCYAPALVAFVGGSGFSISISSGPAIGWFPLGPREIYRPAYHVSRNYFRQVNISNTVINNTTNITNIYNTYTKPGRADHARVNYANLHAPNGVTAVAPAAFARGHAVNRALVSVPATAVGAAQVEHVARIAPQRSAFTGAAPVARAAPPAAVERRGVVARAAPPPPPVPISRQLPVLDRNPGVAISHAQASALRRDAPVTAPEVRLVVPKPASNSRRGRAEVAPPMSGVPGEERSAPTRRPETARPEPAHPEAARSAEPARAPTRYPSTPSADGGTRGSMHAAPPRPQTERAPRPPTAQAPNRQVEHAPRPSQEQAPRPPMVQAPRPPVEHAPRPPMTQQAPRPPTTQQAPRPPVEHAQRPPPPPPRGDAPSGGEENPHSGGKGREGNRGSNSERP